MVVLGVLVVLMDFLAGFFTCASFVVRLFHHFLFEFARCELRRKEKCEKIKKNRCLGIQFTVI